MLRNASSTVLRAASGAARTAVSGSRAKSSFALPSLPYEISALEPVVKGEIMSIHHSKHHQAYVTNLNAAMDKYADAEAKGDLSTMIALQGALKFNGGGHLNHSIFWTNLCAPKDYTDPSGELAKAIEAKWGSVDNFKTSFNATAAAIQGSGWAWLAASKADGSLSIQTRANQDPLSFGGDGLVPLVGIDVWEHAYYLQYKNARPEYLKEIWKVVNWKNAAERYAAK
mmetsp:Transcript_4115/g.10254  ORF Transcript_4115/g.10254 Transcript_4115/m.10254 type:complete len:227 (+) Transcript_4115:57-737(+)|eukprot:CAMPEP_0206236210 /NCGR_PEP_ID=MMETSP0047_2-20121206/13584_1 /ASSEMBLY_ACC=CAM_ASM_000192 /TAXON_ID=195065 /ORGANISM="Chroomonas mesostigmatica_cf, Strain CCMP1168" /LENGTH=226 /DNA_ID=CAMNT_0053660511 /DNA_START=47 /DNA_END=727 /DNA_ORIENTATION=-